MTGDDIRAFNEYLRNATDEQVRGIWRKEKNANHDDYAALAENEAQRRGLFWLE